MPEPFNTFASLANETVFDSTGFRFLIQKAAEAGPINTLSNIALTLATMKTKWRLRRPLPPPVLKRRAGRPGRSSHGSV